MFYKSRVHSWMRSILKFITESIRYIHKNIITTLLISYSSENLLNLINF